MALSNSAEMPPVLVISMPNSSRSLGRETQTISESSMVSRAAATLSAICCGS